MAAADHVAAARALQPEKLFGDSKAISTPSSARDNSRRTKAAGHDPCDIHRTCSCSKFTATPCERLGVQRRRRLQLVLPPAQHKQVSSTGLWQALRTFAVALATPRLPRKAVHPSYVRTRVRESHVCYNTEVSARGADTTVPPPPPFLRKMKSATSNMCRARPSASACAVTGISSARRRLPSLSTAHIKVSARVL